MPKNLPHDLKIRSKSGTSSYTFVVADGKFEAGPDTEDNDRLANADRRASGYVGGSGEDSYRFGGVIVKAYPGGSGSSEVVINGKTYPWADLPEEWQRDAEIYDEWAGADTPTPKTVAVRDEGGLQPNDYRLVVSSGHIENATEYGTTSSTPERRDANANGQPRIYDSVWGGGDSWHIGDTIVNLALTDPDNADINLDGDGWKPAMQYDFVATLGESDDPETEPPDPISEPEHNDTGGPSEDPNRVGVRGRPNVDDWAYVAVPGDLKSTMSDVYEDSGARPGNEVRTYVDMEKNSVYDPGFFVVPRGMILNATGTTFAPSSSYDLAAIDHGAQILNPYVNGRMIDGGKGNYDARWFTFDPKYITAGTDGRRGGFIDQNAWLPRSGRPHNKFRFLENTRQNQFANGAGVKNAYALNHWRDNSTLFHYHNDQDDDSWHNSSLALFRNSGETRGVAYPVDIHSEGIKGYINSTYVMGMFAGFKRAYTVRGSQTARKNYFFGGMQPQEGVTEHLMYIDNPTAELNQLWGWMWDPHKSSGAAMRVKRSESGGWRKARNFMLDFTGHTSDSKGMFEDTSDGEENAVFAVPRAFA